MGCSVSKNTNSSLEDNTLTKPTNTNANKLSPQALLQQMKSGPQALMDKMKSNPQAQALMDKMKSGPQALADKMKSNPQAQALMDKMKSGPQAQALMDKMKSGPQAQGMMAKMKSGPQALADKMKSSAASFKTQNLSDKFTTNYGDGVNMIAFIGSVYSRLAYMNDHQFLGHYTKIFGPIIPDTIMRAINQQVITNGLPSLLIDKQMFNLTNDDYEGLKTYPSGGGLSLQFLPWAQKINIINGEQRIDANTANCSFETDETIANNNLVFISIATSNYSEIYVVGDKRMPNIVNVIFRGTSDAKSAGSYSKISSLISMPISRIEKNGDISEHTQQVLYGIYKILIETSHILMHSIEHIAKQIQSPDKKNKVSIITTGQSLGGGLATLFAFVYVTEISSKPTFSSDFPSLDINIACFSYGSPRVLGTLTAAQFCYLTTNNKDEFINDPAYKAFIESATRVNILGRITYLRIVTTHDPIPALPKIGFSHPCSSLTESTRKNVNIDCLTQVSNSFSNRCRGNRLAMTFDMEKLPLNCVGTKEDAKKRGFGPIIAKMPFAYHLNYLGISYVGCLVLENVIGNNIIRVKNDTPSQHSSPIIYKKNDTVCRILLYPYKNSNFQLASISFFDLSVARSISNVPELQTRDVDREAATKTEKASGTDELKLSASDTPAQTPSVVGSPGKLGQMMDNLRGKNTLIEIPQDIKITQNDLQTLIEKSEEYNIIQTIIPPLTGTTLIDINLDTQGSSFEGIISANSTGGNRKSRKSRKYRK